MKQATFMGVTILISVVVAAGLVIGLTPLVTPKATALPAKDRIIYMTAVEFKGSTTVDKLDAPKIDTAKLESAYTFKWTEPDKRWEVSAYAWEPSQVVVNQGDRVKIVFFGVNGDKHTVTIDNYITKDFIVNRGRWVTQEFVASVPGAFLIKCDEHKPHMTGTLVVLPRA